MVVIYDTLGAYGGSHTLMLRMGEWLRANDTKVTIICARDSNTEIVEKLKSIGVEIICASLADIRLGYEIIKKLMDIETIKFYSFAWNFYLDVERIKKKYSLDFDNLIYCIHPDTFKKGRGFKSEFLQSYAKRSYGAILNRMNKNNALMMVDKVDLEESEKFYSFKLEPKPPIIMLPMYCPERDDAEEIIKHGYEDNVLLTAARADFPFKGYMVGLVDIFAKLKTVFSDIKLEIVAAGDDINMLRDRIALQDEDVKRAISVHAWMDYEDLKAKMRECKVFIGMGTTIFDAALQYKPTIAVKFNTFDCIADRLVADRPTYMTVPLDCTVSAYGIIEEVFAWDFAKYREESYRSFNEVKRVYDIDERMSELMNRETISKESILTNFECWRHGLNYKFNRIRFRNKKEKNDFRNLQRETKI